MYVTEHHGPTLVSSDTLERLAFDSSASIDIHANRAYLTLGRVTFYAILPTKDAA